MAKKIRVVLTLQLPAGKATPAPPVGTALGLVDARPVGGQKRKGADSGIDGVITFTDAGGALPDRGRGEH